MRATLYYAHDPMCSWCWAFRPAYQYLRESLPATLRVSRLLGGLAPDNNNPMPRIMRNYIRGQWQKIQQAVPETEFNFAFWENCEPKRSTWPACRAVIAARQQGDAFDEKMTLAIQRGYYLQARNPSEARTLAELAGETGLDVPQFSADLQSQSTEKTLQAEIQQCRDLGLFGFPGLVLVNDRMEPVIVDVNYLQPQAMLEQINAVI